MEEREQGFDRRLIVLAVFALIAVGVVAAILIGRGGDEGGSTAAGANGCREVEAPQPKTVSFKQPKRVLAKGEAATAVVETSCGTFEIALDTTQTPLATNSFAFLAEEGFYDGLTFHRVAPGFVVQGGDPQGTGSGGPGYNVIEQPPEDLSYTKGVVAMAKTAADPPGTSGSQFFIVIGVDAGLPSEYSVIGKVGKGMGTVERIGKLGTAGETPKQTVLIEAVTIQRD